MEGSRSQHNKSHKSRFRSKASRQTHKTSNTIKKRVASKSGSNQNVAKAARIQRNKMVRDSKRAEILKEKRAFSGSTSPPFVIVLFGLSPTANVKSVHENLLSILAPENCNDMCLEHDEGKEIGLHRTIGSAQYKLRTTVMVAPHGDLPACLEMAKVADLVAFVTSANGMAEDDLSKGFLDPFGSLCLSLFRALGLPSTVVLMIDQPADLRKKQDAKKACKDCLSSELPESCEFFGADTNEELHKFLWKFKQQRLSVPHWRSTRSYVVAHEVDMQEDSDEPTKATLLISGYVRAHSLSVNQLVHVSGAGDFQLRKIDFLEDPFPLNEKRQKANSMDFDDASCNSKVIRSLLPDSAKLEPLITENIPDPLAGEQTWPTEDEVAEAESANQGNLSMKKLPKGTSEYQAAWILDDIVDDDVDNDDGEEPLNAEENSDGMVVDEGAGLEGSIYYDQLSLHSKAFDDTSETDTIMGDDENLTKEDIAREIQKLKQEHAEDEEFPDEVDTPLDVPAKRRFAKFRGLKSFRTSAWDPKESLPADYAKIFAFDNFSRTQKHVFSKAREIDASSGDECASVGSYVRLHIGGVASDTASRLLKSKVSPLVACGLFQHESKMSVLHFSVRKHDSCDIPIKSKDRLIFHSGFRQFNSRPVFSSDSINADKHKMERFLHTGKHTIASVYAPISFPPSPVIVLKDTVGETDNPHVVAVGSLRSVNPDRIILKRIILTGYPKKVMKSRAFVRFMFHSPEDIRWFKPVELWTKCGRRGLIKEPVGTHGAMKCSFDGFVQQHDTVCMSLYKRVYPKWPEQLYR